MRKKELQKVADRLAVAVNSYRREKEHPLSDASMREFLYKDMILALEDYNDRELQ